jgi:hypothetical protein
MLSAIVSVQGEKLMQIAGRHIFFRRKGTPSLGEGFGMFVLEWPKKITTQ